MKHLLLLVFAVLLLGCSKKSDPVATPKSPLLANWTLQKITQLSTTSSGATYTYNVPFNPTKATFTDAGKMTLTEDISGSLQKGTYNYNYLPTNAQMIVSSNTILPKTFTVLLLTDNELSLSILYPPNTYYVYNFTK